MKKVIKSYAEKICSRSLISDIKIDCDKFGVSYAGLELKAIRFTQEEIDKAMKIIMQPMSKVQLYFFNKKVAKNETN